jgi:hypothetical protein
MKKRVISMLLSVAFAAGMILPAVAAAPAEAGSVQERIDYIKETYDIIVKDGRQPQRNWTDDARSGRADFEKNLTELETALKILGAVFTKRLSSKVDGDFEVYLLFGRQCPEPYKNAVGIAHETYIDGEHDTWIEFLGPAGTSLAAGYMLHEFGHCMEFLLTRNPPYDFSSTTRRAFYSSLHTNKAAPASQPSSTPSAYASLRGEMDNREDYAECFRTALYGGNDNPLQYGCDTEIYQKTYEVYIDLAAFAGYGARATKRAAAYLGVELPLQ